MDLMALFLHCLNGRMCVGSVAGANTHSDSLIESITNEILHATPQASLYTKRYLWLASSARFGAIFFGFEFLRLIISKLIMRLPTPHRALAGGYEGK